MALNGTAGELSAPGPLADDHDLEPFDCGEPHLDAWLKRRARANQASGASRTYVVCAARRVVAFSALASGAVAMAAASDRLKRNMPEPIPMIVLGRLAVDRAWQGADSGGRSCATQSSGRSRPPGSSARAGCSPTR